MIYSGGCGNPSPWLYNKVWFRPQHRHPLLDRAELFSTSDLPHVLSIPRTARDFNHRHVRWQLPQCKSNPKSDKDGDQQSNGNLQSNQTHSFARPSLQPSAIAKLPPRSDGMALLRNYDLILPLYWLLGLYEGHQDSGPVRLQIHDLKN